MVGTETQSASKERLVQPDGAVLISGRGIRMRVAVLRPGHVLLTVTGGRANYPEDVRAETLMIAELDRELRKAGTLTVFADLRETSRMSAESREVASRWMRENKQALKASHVLVGSKLLEMAMSIVGMLVGGGVLKMYSQQRAFLEIVRQVAPELSALPKLDRPPAATGP